MRRTAYMVFGVSLGLTVLFALLWVFGFFFAFAAVGGLIHILLVLALITSLGVVAGLILLIVSYLKK